MSVLQTSGVTKQLQSADDVIAELLGGPVGAGQVRTVAPAAAGLYAWWASPEVLPALKGPAHPSTPNLRLLYIGLATKLRSRLATTSVEAVARLCDAHSPGLCSKTSSTAPDGRTASSWSTTTSGG